VSPLHDLSARSWGTLVAMTQPVSRPLRSVLFTPATRPDRVAKLPSTGADLGVVDLEDAVAPNAKADARTMAIAACDTLAEEHPEFALAVRVNAVHSEHFLDDVAGGLALGIRFVMVPKVESADDLRSARDALDARGLGEVALIAGIESGAGVLRCEASVSVGLASAIYFGAEDYIADLGGERTPQGHEVLYARSHVALVARVNGVVALDQIVPAHTDDEQFRRDAAVGRSIGYGGKLCIHPRQVPLAHQAFSPSPEAVDRARSLVDHYEAALADGVGVVTFDGQMVDQPMLRHARSVLAAGDSAAAAPSTTREA
jgi:citrate lyase subunit beta / citryl-CoA lyase